MTDPFATLRPRKFGLLLADPPWASWAFRAYSDKGLTRSAQSHYACMKLLEIQALPVSSLAEPDCVCVMWGKSVEPGRWTLRWIRE